MTWIADAITRDMFSTIRSSLKLVDKLQVTLAEKKENRYWQVAPRYT